MCNDSCYYFFFQFGVYILSPFLTTITFFVSKSVLAGGLACICTYLSPGVWELWQGITFFFLYIYIAIIHKMSFIFEAYILLLVHARINSTMRLRVMEVLKGAKTSKTELCRIKEI